MYREHTLPSGEIIAISNEHTDHPAKPWRVVCYDTDDSCRWSVDFATQEEAEKEYVRFD